jgi:anthranilate phosphoribosyltransferase
MTFLDCLHTVCAGRDLSPEQAQFALDWILDGQASGSQIGALLAALKTKGESAAELTGFARGLRARMQQISVTTSGKPLLDTCGTGGDGADTFNISTVAAFVVAAAGLPVAKHGNRSISSRCGSADVLEGLGVKLSGDPAHLTRCVEQAGIGFLFAPMLHPALKIVQPVRQELKMRTIFNLLGPLANPASADVQLVGAPSVIFARHLAESLSALGLKNGMVVHGDDGLDEITLTGGTTAFRITNSVVEELRLQPEDFGVPRCETDALKGGDVAENIQIARGILSGKISGAKRDIVLVNASAALVCAGLADNWREGYDLAEEALASGKAWQRLDLLAAI